MAFHPGKRKNKALRLWLLLAAVLVIGGLAGAAGMWWYMENAGETPVPAGTPFVFSGQEETKVLQMTQEDLTKGSLVLVNNETPWSFPENKSAVSVFDVKNDDYHVKDKYVQLNGVTVENLNAMLKDFRAYSGLKTVNVTSGIRSYEYQQQVYAEVAAEKGEQRARSFVAQPGCSEHHTGYAVDFNLYYEDRQDCGEFTGEGVYAWFDENAWRYGFIRRYSADKQQYTFIGEEPWHFRYVGVPHARYMLENDLCLEEYLQLLRSYDFDHPLVFTCDGSTYRIYYTRGMQVQVPDEGDYIISGNNVDGFIVTAGT